MTFYIQMCNYCTHFFHFSTGILYYCWYHLRNDSRSDEEVLLQNAVREGGSHPIYRKMLHTLHIHLRPVLRNGIAKSPIRIAYNIEISNEKRISKFKKTDVANTSVPPLKISNFRNSADFDWSGKKTDPTKSLQALHTFAPSGLAAINICSQLASALCSLPSARLQAAPGPFPSFLASFLWRRHWIFSFLSGAPSLAIGRPFPAASWCIVAPQAICFWNWAPTGGPAFKNGCVQHAH